MSDIVERLDKLRRWLLDNDLDVEMPEGMIDPEEAADEITLLRAEVERLNKSRNKWGQKYNKLLEEHKVVLSQLKTAVWSDSEECKLLNAENERLCIKLREILAVNTSYAPGPATRTITALVHEALNIEPVNIDGQPDEAPGKP